MLEGSELALRSAQLAVDDADALLDELSRLLRHLVLLVVGVLMKSTPRRLTVFLKDTLAIVVVLDEGVTLNSLP